MAALSVSVRPSNTNVRAGRGLGGGGGSVGRGARSMRGAAGGRPAGARPSAPHGGSVLAPQAPWSTSAPGRDASRALVSVVSPLQPPKGTGRGDIRLYVHPIISPFWDHVWGS